MTIKPKTKSSVGVILLFVFDLISLTGFYYIAACFRKFVLPLIFSNVPSFQINLLQYYWVFPVWIFIMAYEGAYTKRISFWDEVKLLWKSSFFTSLAIFTILFIGKRGISYSRVVLLAMVISSFLLFPFVRPLYKRFLYSIGLLKRKVLIIGSGEMGRVALCALKNEKNLGYEVAGFIDDVKDLSLKINGFKVHKGIEKIERYIKRCNIQDVVIAKNDLEKQRLVDIINRLQHLVENILFIPEVNGIAVLGTELRHFFHEQTIVIEIKNNLDNLFNYIFKRIFDYVVALILFFPLIVLIIIISMVIRITSKGPAIFKQERIGKNGKIFSCYKFRTMYIDADKRLKDILDNDPEARAEWEKYWKLKNDPRVTKIGKFLRKTSLDELPQIFNVLKGEMSLVGPRPVTEKEINIYYKDTANLYFSVPPGITGLWQVSGRNNTTYEQRVSLDAWYVRNWNLWLDIVILLKTVVVVIKREGAC